MKPVVAVFPSSDPSGDRLHEIRELLFGAFEDFTEEDWRHTLGGWHVVVRADDALVAHAAVVPRHIHVEERAFAAGYVEGVATATSRQRSGYATSAMTAVSAVLQTRFDLGVLSTGEHHFYERLGWERWRGPTFVRDRHELVRTDEEDDGVMVLRFGPSRDVDLTAPISCDKRSGGDW